MCTIEIRCVQLCATLIFRVNINPKTLFQELTLCMWWNAVGSSSLYFPALPICPQTSVRVKLLLALVTRCAIFLNMLCPRSFFHSMQYSCQGLFSSGLDSLVWKNNLWGTCTNFLYSFSKYGLNLVCIVEKDLNITWKKNKQTFSYSFLMYCGHIHYWYKLFSTPVLVIESIKCKTCMVTFKKELILNFVLWSL